MYILIVDPDTALAKTMAEYLRAQKHKVRVVHTADQAIASCDMTRPDCIVLELALGAHSGVEFLHEFRSYKDWQSVPVIVLTMVDLPNQDALVKLGVQKYLYKPTSSLDKLRKAVQEIRP
jgi:DNA-binding response OmpR family regulator